ncbi:MAG: helix-turn-helix transcriptional regulator [Balneolaceae bacterium]
MDEQIKSINDFLSAYEYIKVLEILTPREVEVLKGVAAGYTSKEIGNKLFISYRTVQKYRENIKKKLDLSGRRSLFRWCEKNLKGKHV